MNESTELHVVHFTPGSFVELDDPMTGERRLVLVAETGTEFVDYVDYDNPPTALAILNVLNPAEWGDYRSISTDMMLAGDLERYQAFSDFILELCKTPAAGDTLTFNRAAKWACDHGEYHVQKAAKAGMVATAEARARQAAISQQAAEWVAAGAV